MVSVGSQTVFLKEPPCARRHTKDEAREQFDDDDDDEDFHFDTWFDNHAAADATVNQHQIDLELLKQKHESDLWFRDNTIHNLEGLRHVYADLMGNIKTVRVCVRACVRACVRVCMSVREKYRERKSTLSVKVC